VLYSRFLSPRDFGIVSIAESVGAGIGAVSGLALEAGCRRLYFQFTEDTNQLHNYLKYGDSPGRSRGNHQSCSILFARTMDPRTGFPGWHFGFFPYLALPILTAKVSQLLACRLVILQCQERHFAFNSFVVLQSFLTMLFTFGLAVWKHEGATWLLTSRAIGACLTLVIATCGSG
jgi:hypothetical protein